MQRSPVPRRSFSSEGSSLTGLRSYLRSGSAPSSADSVDRFMLPHRMRGLTARNGWPFSGCRTIFVGSGKDAECKGTLFIYSLY